MWSSGIQLWLGHAQSQPASSTCFLSGGTGTLLSSRDPGLLISAGQSSTTTGPETSCPGACRVQFSYAPSQGRSGGFFAATLPTPSTVLSLPPLPPPSGCLVHDCELDLYPWLPGPTILQKPLQPAGPTPQDFPGVAESPVGLQSSVSPPSANPLGEASLWCRQRDTEAAAHCREQRHKDKRNK